MSEISVSKVLEALEIISKEESTARDELSNIKKCLDSVSEYSQTLANYHGKIKDISYTNKDDTVTTTTTRWVISVPENLKSASKNCNARIEEMSVWMERLNSEINNSEEIANYIVTQVNQLGQNLSTTDLATAFGGALATSISLDEYSAAKKKFVSISDKNMKYWTDKPLQFQYDSKTGSYLILQEDSNGKLVGMGWTDKDSVINYMKELEKCSSKAAGEGAQAITEDAGKETQSSSDEAAKDAGKETQSNSDKTVQDKTANEGQQAVNESAKDAGKETQSSSDEAAGEGQQAAETNSTTLWDQDQLTQSNGTQVYDQVDYIPESTSDDKLINDLQNPKK